MHTVQHFLANDPLKRDFSVSRGKEAHAKSIATPAPLIGDDFVETHAKVLPRDIVYAPYHVDNLVFHFPLPPLSKPTSNENSPLDSAVNFTPRGFELQEPATTEWDKTGERHTREKTRIKSAKRDIPLGKSSLQNFGTPPPFHDAYSKMETLNTLEDKLKSEQNTLQASLKDKRIQLAALPNQKHSHPSIGPPHQHAQPHSSIFEKTSIQTFSDPRTLFATELPTFVSAKRSTRVHVVRPELRSTSEFKRLNGPQSNECSAKQSSKLSNRPPK